MEQTGTEGAFEASKNGRKASETADRIRLGAIAKKLGIVPEHINFVSQLLGVEFEAPDDIDEQLAQRTQKLEIVFKLSTEFDIPPGVIARIARSLGLEVGREAFKGMSPNEEFMLRAMVKQKHSTQNEGLALTTQAPKREDPPHPTPGRMSAAARGVMPMRKQSESSLLGVARSTSPVVPTVTSRGIFRCGEPDAELLSTWLRNHASRRLRVSTYNIDMYERLRSVIPQTCRPILLLSGFPGYGAPNPSKYNELLEAIKTKTHTWQTAGHEVRVAHDWMLHAKLILGESCALVGSANFTSAGLLHRGQSEILVQVAGEDFTLLANWWDDAWKRGIPPHDVPIKMPEVDLINGTTEFTTDGDKLS